MVNAAMIQRIATLITWTFLFGRLFLVVLRY